jgi:arylsulfatase A-like enzyme
LRFIVSLFALVAWATAMVAGGSDFVPSALAERGPPTNVLLIVADDMRADGLQHMPVMRRLAQRGITFSQAFVTTPLCCPSRASILTGQYAHHHGVLANKLPNGGMQSFNDSSTLATWLQAAGVRTGLAGRYLNGYESTYIPPGWDFWFALWQVSEEYSNYYDYRVTDQGERRYYDSKPESYSTRVLTKQALSFMAGQPERPFMLHLSPRTPHSPATADRLDNGAFKGMHLATSPSLNEADVSDKPEGVRTLDLLSEDELEKLDRFRRRQLDSLLSLDRGIGELVEALRVDGRLNQTWLIFTSDNGLTLGEHRIGAHKSCPYEECVRVPLVVIPPGGLSAARTDARLVANIDLAPTIAEIMGADAPEWVDGVSFLPLLADQAASWRGSLLLEMFKEDEDGARYQAVRTHDRKLVRYPNGEEELYDLTADPFELQNLASDPTRDDEKAGLARDLDTLVRKASAGAPSAPAGPR